MVIPIKKLMSGETVVGLSEFQTGDVIPGEYLDIPPVPAGDNLIINGDFCVAQRGTSFTSTTWRPNNDDSYLLDRWLLLSDGNDIVDVTQISGAFSRSRYALQAEVETANKKFGFCQIIEANTCIPLRGQKISISFAAKTVTDKLVENVRVAVLEWAGTADQVTSDVVSAWNVEGLNPTWATNWAALNTPANLALTTTEQTFKVENLTVGASCNNLAVFVWVDDTDAAVDDILQLGEVQVVRGSVAPDFVYRDDYDACCKRCLKTYPYSTTPGTATPDGSIALYYEDTSAKASGNAWALAGNIRFPIIMSGVPTITIWDGVGTVGKWWIPTAGYTASIAGNIGTTGFELRNNAGTAVTPGIGTAGGHYIAEAEL